MTPTAAVPLGEFTPYLLRQTGLRASLLLTSFGFSSDDWDDLQQDLVLDCLRRMPKFNASRGDWKGFVRGVVRNHACVLASRQIRRREFQPLQMGTDGEASEDSLVDSAGSFTRLSSRQRGLSSGRPRSGRSRRPGPASQPLAGSMRCRFLHKWRARRNSPAGKAAARPGLTPAVRAVAGPQA